MMTRFIRLIIITVLTGGIFASGCSSAGGGETESQPTASAQARANQNANSKPADDKEQPMSVYDFTMKRIDGEDVALSRYHGDVLLIVNVASKCGLTPQYKDLESVYREYKDRGFRVLGFPANDFMGQEPGTNADIKKFCRTKYDVTFDMFSKISVKGDGMHPLYQFLTKHPNKDIAGSVRWNFQKYVVDRDGKVVAKFGPRTKPRDKKVITAIEKALQQDIPEDVLKSREDAKQAAAQHPPDGEAATDAAGS